MDMFSLKGKVAIVTGSSTGLGQGVCKAYAEAGAKVVGADYVPSAETAKMLGGDFHSVTADLMTLAPIPGIIARAVETFGRVDILVNNAGIIRREDAVNFSEKDWDDVLALDAKTVFFFSQAAAKRFMEQKSGGKIISIASMLSYQGGVRVPSYTAAKSAVKGITMSMANEWAKFGINVNAIAPGYMATNNTAQLRRDKDRSEAILDRIPAGRWGTPDDIMGAAVFLASRASDYIHGFTLAVDGGWLAR
ncbi:MAG: 2-dehydro-3-deoxy-D-gluconate 5-dehydrogenase KduD [Clostridiales bacterium]|jgi:2-deoxy-D-gluconate 3-dehydrogenase|nr:2-dehydro-3-deoxy-D-gluconate 5-dehydrogenase KduD [Clostridiales bacterium]